MDKRLLSLYLSRILSGQYVFIHNQITYKLIYPDISIKYAADIYAQNEYEKNKFNDWIYEDDILNFLISIDIWSHDGDKKLEDLENQIENSKVELYNNFLNPTRIKSIKRNLLSIKNAHNKLYDLRHSLDHITPAGFSQTAKNQFILINSLYYNDNTKVFEDFNSVDYELLNSLSININQNMIDMSTFRQLARNEIWKNYWSANNSNIFGKPTINWTDEQKTLVVISKMYDSAYEHPECPPDSIIEDDDMFDGWMIIQRREHEKNKDKNRNEKMLKDKNLGDAREVFLMANSKEEAQNIYGLNNPNARNTIKERNKIITNSDSNISETDLPDIQRDLLIQQNKQFMQTRKK